MCLSYLTTVSNSHVWEFEVKVMFSRVVDKFVFKRAKQQEMKEVD